MAPKYGEPRFDPKCGFTGSAGKTMVSGYARGGPVKKPVHDDVKQDKALIASELKKRGLRRGGKVC